MHRSSLSILIILMLFVVTILGNEPKCSYCNKSIEGNYLTADGKSYHENCYRDHVQPRCAYCEKVIEGKYNLLDEKMYHNKCYIDHIVPRCDICGGPLQGTYLTDFWGNSFHERHSSELPECSTCGRWICDELTRGGFELGDGRFLCGICNETEVSGDFLLESSISYVRRLLESNGITNLPDDIPITLVDQQRLKQLASSYSDAMHGFTDHNTQTRNGRVVSKDSHIYILSHLPLTMFRAILAHELMHVYLFERDLDLRADIREGFCNLGAASVYKDTPSEYAKFRLLNMDKSQDPDYGYGYRKMSQLLERRGWRYLLETLKEIN
ncbi:MAG: protein DA1 [FCB group bacterium]|nr:protein DA1 [FCB group bacterium]MBL7029320.1 protein DA1 [Candidatus Neomarinimicrobiota bacterium]MBL7122642.1 protein DA1 [Candidatus Neomarinimicrobiota bacterium]